MGLDELRPPHSGIFVLNLLGLNNDSLDAVHKFERPVTIFDRLRRFAPAAIEDGIGCGDIR